MEQNHRQMTNEAASPLSRRSAIARIGAFALTLLGAGASAGLAKAPAKPVFWDSHMELGIDLEINPPDGFRYRPPYVAVWLEDKDGNPIRTLSLWVERPPKGLRWMPELHRWYQDGKKVFDTGGPDLILTVSSATRMPGKYSLVWDGKDDRGRAVTQGTYIVNLETAREHGPYTLVQKTIEIGAKPFTTAVPGNAELKGATIEYRKHK